MGVYRNNKQLAVGSHKDFVASWNSAILCRFVERVPACVQCLSNANVIRRDRCISSDFEGIIKQGNNVSSDFWRLVIMIYLY